MYQIDNPSAVVTQPASTAAGTAGFFTDGNPAAGVPATIVPAEWLNAVQEEMVNVLAAAGIAQSKSAFNQLAAAIRATSPPVGSARGVRMSVTAAAATATLTATELVVENAGGLGFRLSTVNQSINLATVGAGGMDTGTAPVNGYVAVYVIYNPSTGAASLLGKDATSTAQTDVYSGANLPAGYTASALVAVWPTNASRQLSPGYQFDREFFFPFVSVLNTSSQAAALTSLNVSSCVPPNAKSCRGFTFLTTTGGTNSTMSVAGSSGSPAGIGHQQMVGYNGTGLAFTQMPFTDVPLITPQTIFYNANISSGTFGSAQLFLSAYKI
jgi:hypothetical protein